MYHICPMAKTNQTDKKGSSLHEAFKTMLQQPDIWKPLRLAKQSILNMRVRMNKKDHPSRDLMHEWLLKAGWLNLVEEVWGPGPKWVQKPPVGRGRPKGSGKKAAKKAAPARKAGRPKKAAKKRK